MALTIKSIVSKISNKDISLAAGAGGIGRYVTWIHMVESVVSTDFLEGNEIAVTTGIGLSPGSNLFDLVRTMDEHHVAAVIVNIGPFLSDVPQSVLDYCNSHDFPLYIVPWKVHLSEIIRMITLMITKDAQREQETAAAFKNAIFFPKEPELYIVPLSQYGYSDSWNYCAISISLEGARDCAARMKNLSDILDSYAQHHFAYCSVFYYEKKIVCAIGNCDSDKMHSYTTNLLQYMRSLLLPGERICAGTGKITKSARCIYKSYWQADKIRRLHAKGNLPEDQIYYDDMNIYKLLMAVDDKEVLEEYYEKTILPLTEYDKAHNSDLLQTLQVYLRNNCSVKETSEELFVHRNTINYKIKRIGEILNKDLSNLTVRTSLSIGLMVKNIL